jgi:hypothetical protein
MDTDVGLELETDVDRPLSEFLNLIPNRSDREFCEADLESGADMFEDVTRRAQFRQN